MKLILIFIFSITLTACYTKTPLISNSNDWFIEPDTAIYPVQKQEMNSKGFCLLSAVNFDDEKENPKLIYRIDDRTVQKDKFNALVENKNKLRNNIKIYPLKCKKNSAIKLLSGENQEYIFSVTKEEFEKTLDLAESFNLSGYLSKYESKYGKAKLEKVKMARKTRFEENKYEILGKVYEIDFIKYFEKNTEISFIFRISNEIYNGYSLLEMSFFDSFLEKRVGKHLMYSYKYYKHDNHAEHFNIQGIGCNKKDKKTSFSFTTLGNKIDNIETQFCEVDYSKINLEERLKNKVKRIAEMGDRNSKKIEDINMLNAWDQVTKFHSDSQMSFMGVLIEPDRPMVEPIPFGDIFNADLSPDVIKMYP